MKLTNPFKKASSTAQDKTWYSADTEAAIVKRLNDLENQGVAHTEGPTSDEGIEMTEDNVFWARTKSGTSWHILRETDDKTLCGKNARYGEHEDVRPTGKTCETCLRQVSPK